MKTTPSRPRDNQLWKDTYGVVSFVYSKLDDINTSHPDETYNTVSKLRNAANDSMFYVSQALGNASPEVGEYDWSNARKSLFALQSMYIFATKQHMLELDPDVIVKIDKLLLQIDSAIADTRVAYDKKSQQDLEPWLEKYMLWKEMQG